MEDPSNTSNAEPAPTQAEPAYQAPPPAAPAAAQGAGIRASALYDYDATDSNELTFKEGELIDVLQQHEYVKQYHIGYLFFLVTAGGLER